MAEVRTVGLVAPNAFLIKSTWGLMLILGNEGGRTRGKERREKREIEKERRKEEEKRGQ